jgi:hypothetical protein
MSVTSLAIRYYVDAAHLPATLFFLRNKSIALSETPSSSTVAFRLVRSRPSCEMLCSAGGTPNLSQGKARKELSQSDTLLRPLTSASSKAITSSRLMVGSTSTETLCPVSVTKVSCMVTVRMTLTRGMGVGEKRIRPARREETVVCTFRRQPWKSSFAQLQHNSVITWCVPHIRPLPFPTIWLGEKGKLGVSFYI